MADTPRIDKEFAAICPAHTPDERARLENSLLTEGQREDILTWRGLVIDGMTRLEILQANGIEPRFAEHPGGIDSREDAIQWIVNNQLARRNLTEKQKADLRGLRVNSEKKRTGAPEGSKNAAKIKHQQTGCLISDKPDVNQRVAKEFGVSHDTIWKDGKFSNALKKIDEVVPGARQDILADRVNIGKAQVVQLAELPAKEIKKVLQAPEKAREVLPKIARQRPENQSEAEFWASQIDAFCRRVEAMVGMVPAAPWVSAARMNHIKDSLRSVVAMVRNTKEPDRVK